jgi:hypothetical protein
MTLRSAAFTVIAALFAGFVAHAAYRESTTCPIVGPCASIHLKLMQTVDWARTQRGASPELMRLASH